MFPGLTTRLSEAVVVNATSITQPADMLRLTATTAIATIIPAQDFVGIAYTFITANKSNNLVISNVFSINVVSEIPIANITANITPNLILKKLKGKKVLFLKKRIYMKILHHVK